MRLYVYYRIAVEDAAPARAAFAAARGESAVELLHRPEPVNGEQTWMEVYAEGLTHLEPQIAAALQPWLSGKRHVEHFENSQLAGNT